LKLKSSELRLIDDLFEMGGGYVLDFSNQTFSEFFEDELSVNIDHSKWSMEGTSKAKRLRYYLRSNLPVTVVKTLEALWNYRESNRKRLGREETIPNAELLFYDVIERLGGRKPKPKPKNTLFEDVDPVIPSDVAFVSVARCQQIRTDKARVCI